MHKRVMLVINLTIVVLIAGSLARANSSATNMDYLSAITIFLVIFFAALLALYLLRLGRGANFDASISLSGRFWPVGRHPYQAFALISTSFILGGVGSIIRTAIVHNNFPMFGLVFIFLGAALIAAMGVQRYLGRF